MKTNLQLGRDERKKIISEIESHRNSKVLVYFVGDRPLRTAHIASDSIRWLYEHLKNMDNDKKVAKIDLYLYSLGGSLETPWPIISVLREYCKELNVLIPYKAFSAATLTSLGADRILMSRKGELGPIDPQLVHVGSKPGTNPIPSQMSTEDISSYISFIKDKIGITDQNALAALTKSLADTVSPPELGQVSRVHFHIRAVAGKMLSQVKPTLTTTKIQEIVEILTERAFIHGHSIGRHEAKQIGLQVDDMDEKVEKLCWDLFLQYEEDLKLNSFTDPLDYFDSDDQDEYVEDDAILACVESTNKCHEYSGSIQMKKIRQPPPQLNLNVNIPIQFPANILGQSIPEETQRMLQEMQQSAANQVRGMIAEQLRKSMPVVDVHISNVKMMWREV